MPGCRGVRPGLELIRHCLRSGDPAAAPPWIVPAFVPEPDAVRASFRSAHAAMVAFQGVGMGVLLPGTEGTTRHERRLLRATAAARSGKAAVLDNLLFKIAPHPAARLALSRAVAPLATGLAASGRRPSRGFIPAPALAVARRRGLDLDAGEVAWHAGAVPAPGER